MPYPIDKIHMVYAYGLDSAEWIYTSIESEWFCSCISPPYRLTFQFRKHAAPDEPAVLILAVNKSIIWSLPTTRW